MFAWARERSKIFSEEDEDRGQGTAGFGKEVSVISLPSFAWQTAEEENGAHG